MSHFQQSCIQNVQPGLLQMQEEESREAKISRKKKSISVRIEYLQIKIEDTEDAIELLDNDLTKAQQEFITARGKMQLLSAKMMDKRLDRKDRAKFSDEYFDLNSIALDWDTKALKIEANMKEEKSMLQELISSQKLLEEQLKEL